MVFDPMKFYDDGQRRQKRYDSLVPVFVVAIVLLVVFGAGFVAYQRSHVKPKPVAPALVLPKPIHDTEVTCSGSWDASDEGCNTWRNQTTVTQSSTTWYRCSDGVTVAGDLKNCPEYAGSGGTKVLDVGHEPFMKDEFSYSRKTPRKHKRKFHEFIGYTGDPVARNIFIESPPANPATKIEFYNPHVRVTLQQLRQYAQEYPAPICILNIAGECWVTLDPDPKPDCLPGGCDHILQMVIRNNEDLVRAEKAAEYDQLVLDHSEDFYDNVFVPGGECTDREQYRELQCVMGGKCKLRNKDASWCLDRTGGDDVQRSQIPATTPQDITNLMEQIAPTAKQERKSCPGGCDDGWDVEENAYACVQDGLMQPPSQKSCAELGQKPAKWPTIASVQIVLTQKQKDAYPGNAWMKPCGPDNHADGCYTPDCKMPADVDVCPTQMLESKGISDEGVDLKKYGVRDGKAKP